MGLRLLETLTSALYEDPIVFFREYVQNSADSFETKNLFIATMKSLCGNH